MSWETIGTIAPSRDWTALAKQLQSRLIRLSFFGDAEWLKRYQPRAYVRLRVGTEGKTKRWETIWPKDGVEELLLIVPIPIAGNFLEVRKRRDAESLSANYSIFIEEWQAEPYLIAYPGQPVTIDGEPWTIDGVQVVI